MVPATGVLSLDWLIADTRYKQDVLAYDKVYVPNVFEELDRCDIGEDDAEKRAAIEYLLDQDFICDAPIDIWSDDLEEDEVILKLADDYWAGDEHSGAAREIGDEMLGDFQDLVNGEHIVSRLAVYLLWRECGEVVMPVVFPWKAGLPSSAQQEVLSVVLPRLPQPSPDLPLDDLLAFKRDDETRLKYGRFWDWARAVAKDGLERHEIEAEVESLLREYRFHVNRLHDDVAATRWEILVTAALGVVQDVARIRPADAAQRLFQLRRRSVAALEEELRAPGNELAYLFDTEELVSAAT